jgi:CARDB
MTRTRRRLAPLLATTVAVLALAAAGAQGAAGGQAPAAAVVASSTGATGATGATTTPELIATLSACHPDPVQSERYATFASQTIAQAVPGTVAMSVDFKLEERGATGTAFLPVKATGFGAWVTSQPRVGIFSYSHEVTALPAPAAFRVLVKARWIGRHKRVLHETAALSSVCVQPLLQPNVVIGRIVRASSGVGGQFQYTVEVRNVGPAPAGPFEVSLSIGSTALAPVTIAALPVGAAEPALFSGPACAAGMTLTATADPAHAIAEPVDPRRTATLSCPIP